jgi:diguanylate cyclase (GGDEF)-like protein
VSFRTKLVTFFVLVVLVPMASVAFVLFNLIGDNETGKADARLASRQAVAVNLVRDLRERADPIALAVGQDPEVAAAIRAGDEARLERRLRELRRSHGAKRIAIVSRRVSLADAGASDAVFPSFRELQTSNGKRQGTIQVSVVDADTFARRVADVTGLEAAVSVGGRLTASTVPGVDAKTLPQTEGTATALGERMRAASYEAPGFGGRLGRITVMEPESIVAADRRESRLLIAGMLLGFLILAVTLAWFIARGLHGQLERFLIAARRIGQGDFSERVPTTGNDDFAALGHEFNKMSDQLSSRLEDLRVERERLRGAMRRTGVAIASNLDRDGLLQVVVSAATDGVGAGAGRASVRRGGGGPLVTVAEAGDLRSFGRRISDVEARALDTGVVVDSFEDDLAALALPLRLRAGDQAAVVAVARSGAPFTPEERELVEYLAVQASTSIENVALHERAEEQAVTDALTGLANRRHFEDRLVEEVERSRRSHEPAGLLMIDIDNFKRVNDRHGHVAGDQVLREVADVLRETAREIDLAARYGGEELALILPGASLSGAGQVAERVRAAIEAREILVDGQPEPLRVTVSVGAAALGHGPEEARALVAAADEALYRAKRLGKNRTELAGSAARVPAE